MAVGQLLSETAQLTIGRNILAVKSGKRRLVIVNGGQSGVDRAALDTAMKLMLPCRGWCPDGRWAEDGAISAYYPLQECGSPTPAVRTELNAIDSDATLVLTKGDPQDGTPLTVERAKFHGKPTLVVTLGEPPDVAGFWQWISEHDVRILNIGGPRESFNPGSVYKESRVILDLILNPTT
jgi:hypothetical protein